MVDTRFEELRAELRGEVSPAALRFEQAEKLLIDYLIFFAACEQEEKPTYTQDLSPFVSFDFPFVTVTSPLLSIDDIVVSQPMSMPSSLIFSDNTVLVPMDSGWSVTYPPADATNAPEE